MGFMTRTKRPGRHRALAIDEDLPNWIRESDNYCLVSVAEDAYTAKAWADNYNAGEQASCSEMYAAAMKALAKMNDERLAVKDRTKAGLRADRKFWEAKACARMRLGR